MKAFLVKKSDEAIDEIKNEMNLRIEEQKQKKINSITIMNPTNSTCICTIESILLKSNGGNISVFIGYKNDNERVDKTLGALNLIYSSKNLEESSFIQVKTKKLEENEEIYILDDTSLILLPEGCIVLNFDEALKDVKLNLKWNEDKIF